MKRKKLQKMGMMGIVGILLMGMLALSGCKKTDSAKIKIGALKGPTTIGLLQLMEEAEAGNTQDEYTFNMAVGADELVPLMVKGELDMALLPANMASILYNKTNGGISVIDINTLGVLYMVSGDESIESMKDLAGRTVYLTGKGTTPDFVLQYLLTANGMSVEDIDLSYRTEPTEVAALLAENPESIGLLPQPFVTVACAQNDALSVRLSLTEEWTKAQGEGGSSLVTGVTVVRNEFLAENPEAVKRFLEGHAASTEYTKENIAETAALCEKAGIVAKKELAAKAILACNITCITGEEMKQALSGYLEILFEMKPESVGGSLPGDDFYYIAK